MNAEFFAAIAQLEAEKGIPQDYMLERVSQALLAAYKRDNAGNTDNVFVEPDIAKKETEYAQFELAEAERLKKELLGVVDGDSYLKEQVIELRYQNQVLREENRSLKDKLEKAYEFMKQFVIGGINLLEKFMEWIGEKVKDVGRGR